MPPLPSQPVRHLRLSWIAALTLGAALSGCGGEPESTTVVVDGSSTVYRISKVAQEEFEKVDQTVDVVVGNSGTGGGFSKYLQGEVDIVDASRPAKAEEEAKAKEQGIPWVKFMVGYDGITVVVNPKNDFVKDLTVEQLKKLWEPDSKVKTWKDLDPSWPDREIKLYCPDEKSGTFDFFTEAINGKQGKQRKDVQANSDDNFLVRGVKNDPDGLGYFGYAYFKANEKDLKALPIKATADAPAIEPTPETILAKTYTPLARPLFIYVKKAAGRRPGASAFVKYYLKNVADLATKARYVAPTADDIKANQEALGSLGGESPAA